jgi:hypothetical protein
MGEGVGIRLRGCIARRPSESGRTQIELHLEHGDCLVCHASKPGCCDTFLHLRALKTRYRYRVGGGVSLTCHREKGPLDRNQDHRVQSSGFRYRKQRLAAKSLSTSSCSSSLRNSCVDAEPRIMSYNTEDLTALQIHFLRIVAQHRRCSAVP